ncbi:MAG TPA: hypothetical protein P5280_18370 [Cyclobacteriaceae bacterium]|nr:hypothetical protein [Cyclobacteriaceae bacterium]
MNTEDLNIQDSLRPNIESPTIANRSSFIKGWKKAVEGHRVGTADAGEDNWFTVGWHAGNTFGLRDDEFRFTLFLWTLNQRRLALGLPNIESIS